MKILIIDDDRNLAAGLQERLEMQKNVVDFRLTQKGGIDMADKNKNYDIIFIDFQFDKEPTSTGADVGMEIRKNHPLSVLILMTAWGKEEIKNYIYVGFDNYWSKYDEGQGANLKKMLADYNEAVEIGMANAQRRCKSIFNTKELAEIKIFLDAVEETINFLEDINNHSLINSYSITAGVYLIKNKKPLNKEILRDMASAASRTKTKKKHKIFSYNYLSSDIFELHLPKGGYTENALKVRYLMQEDPTNWKKAKGLKPNNKPYYNPIRVIAKEFDLITKD